MAGRPIDEKIVVMRLDNSDFKQKAVETTGLFGKLKDSLNKVPGVNLGKTVEDLNGIKNAANNTNLNPLAASVQGVGKQFSAMQVIATTALATIVNKATNAGTALARSLSLEQVKGGFEEYELKMGSIQTILANTQKHGTTLKDVTKSFEELNDYADKTIYNFGDMTRNIGLFTNAGLKLEESTSMIKGFSNMAAASGTNSERAAGAAYQLSQGLSSGYLMTMDWMSLTNAGMGNDNMKRDLIALGKAMGTLDDHYTEKQVLEDWKNLLTDEKWMTSDVMSAYLRTMAGDMSNAELKALGLTDAQIKLMQQNAKTGEEAATKTRTFTAMMDTLKESIGSGWAVTFETILGDFNEATELFSKAGDFLTGIVGKSSDARNKLLKDVADGGGFKNIFSGLANFVKPIQQIFSAIRTSFRMVFPPASADTIIKITEAFKKMTDGLSLAPGRITQVTNIFRGLFSIFSTAWEIIKRLTAAFVNLIPGGAGSSVLDIIEKVAKLSTAFNRSVKEGNGLTSFIDGMGTVFGKLSTFLGDVGGGVVKFAGFLTNNLGKAINWIKEALAPVGAYFKEAFGGSYGDEALGAGVLVAIVAIVQKIRNFFDNDFDIFGGLGDMVEGITETFSGIGEAVNNFATSIKYVNLILIATALGLLAMSLKLLEGISVEDLTKGITSLALALGVMIAGMVVMNKFNVVGGVKVAVTLIALATATTIMASALKKISDLDTQELIRGISGLAGIVASLSLSMIAMSKFGGKIGASSLQLLALAGAIVILAQAVETMSAIKPKDLFTSIGALTLIFAGLAGFLKVANGSKFGPGSAVGILAIAGAINIIVMAIDDIAEFNVEELIKGLSTITLILAALALFSKVAGGPQMMMAGAGMLLIAGALNAMIGPITTFSGMSWEELAKGMAAMAASLIILAGAAYLMAGGIVGAVGTIAMAAALNLLVVPIERFAAMTWTEMLKGFAGVAIGMGLMAGAAALLTPVVPSMLAFGAGLLLMGAAVLAAGVGMAAFGTGLVTLASLTAGSVAAIISALSLLIQGLGSLVGQVVSLVVKIVSALIDGLAVLIPKLIDLGWQIITAFMNGLEANLPGVVDKGAQLVIKLLDGMNEHIPAIVDSITNLMNTLATSVEQNSGSFINAWLSLMTEVSVVMVKAGSAVIDALFGWIPGVGDVTSQIGEVAETNIREAFEAQKVAEEKGSEFASTLAGTKGAAGEAGTSLARSAEQGASTANLLPIGNQHGVAYSGGIIGTTGLVQNAGTAIGNSALSGASSINLNPIGASAGSGFAAGISSGTGASRTAGVGIANAGEAGARTISADAAGANFGQGFANGIASKEGTVRRVAGGIAAMASGIIGKVLDMHSPSRVTTKQGQHTGQGFANGIANKKKEVAKQAKATATAAKKEFGKDMDNAEYRFKMGKTDSKGYISELRKIKSEYSKYPDLVKKANLEIKSAEKDAAKHRETLKKKEADAKKKAFDDEKRRIDDLKYYGKLSLQQELVFWQNTQKKYKAGSDQRREADREVYRLKNDISKKALDDEKKRIDELDYYGKLSLQQELKYYQDLTKKHKAGSDERKAAEREVYRVKNEISQKALDDEKKRIDELDYYGKLTLDQELKYYQDLVKKHKAGSDERKEAEREVYRVKQEMSQKILDDEKARLDKEKEMIDDKKYYNQLSIVEELKAMQKLNAQYKKGSEERKASEREIYRLKNEINKQLMAISDDYNDKVREANKKLIDGERALTEEYENAVKDRAKSLAGFTGLFDKVAGANRVSATTLMRNLKGQVDAFSKWSDSIGDLSKRGIDEGLLEQLRDMGPSATGELKALNSMTDEQLKEYVDLWKTKNNLARDEAETQLQGMKSDTARKIAELRAETASQLEVYKGEWLEKIRQIREGTENEFIPLKASMNQVGRNSIQGLMEGLDELTPELMAQAKAIADAVASTIRAALEINSPSALTTRFGEFVSQGLANGMENDIDRVRTSAQEVANTAKDSLLNILDTITPKDNTIRLDVELNTKGLDLNGFKIPAEYIPDTSLTTGLAMASMSSIRRQNGNNNPRESIRETEVPTKSTTISQTLNFHTKEMSPSEVARKNLQTSRRLAMEV